MATIKAYQGKAQPFTIDLSGEGTITAVEVNIYKKNEKTIANKHKYPETEGWETIVKSEDNYTFTLTAALTNEMLGAYGIDLTYYVDGLPIGGQSEIEEGILIIEKPLP